MRRACVSLQWSELGSWLGGSSLHTPFDLMMELILEIGMQNALGTSGLALGS